jgi:hypothetical protein
MNELKLEHARSSQAGEKSPLSCGPRSDALGT